MWKGKFLILFGVSVAILLGFCPFILDSYWLRLLTHTFMFALLTQAINIIAGYTGYPAFGNVVFFGLGAYCSGILMVKLHTSFISSTIVGLIICLLYSLIFGLPLLRLRGHYFAIATLGLNEATRAVVDNLSWLTGGGMGLSVPLAPGNIDANTRFFYWCFYGAMIISVLVTYIIVSCPMGYALRSIRSDERAAEGMGINTTKYKVTVWMISGALTGIAGSLYAYWMSYIEPSAVFDMTIAIKAFVMFLLGGPGTLFGPIIGAFFVEIISAVVWSHLLTFHLGTLGLMIILVVVFVPRGFVSFIRERIISSGLVKNGYG